LADPNKLAAFRTAAALAFPRDLGRAERLTKMEEMFLDSQFNTDADQDVQLLIGLFKDRSMVEVTEWLDLRLRHTGQLLIGPLSGFAADPDLSRAAGSRVSSPPPNAEAERARAVHNECVKLNATFFNSLAVWFAGAGAAGALINTLLANGVHNYTGAGEIGGAGIIIAIVLKLLANREIGKLR
jgi:hypothetical protein